MKRVEFGDLQHSIFLRDKLVTDVVIGATEKVSTCHATMLRDQLKKSVARINGLKSVTDFYVLGFLLFRCVIKGNL